MRPLLATLSAVVVTTAALSGIAPAAAQDYFVLRMPDHARAAPYYFGPRPFAQERRERLQEFGADLLAFACSSRSGDALEQMFAGIDRRLDLNAEQRPLFEDLRTTTLVAQTGFADSCDAFPEGVDNPVDRMKLRQANLSAQLAAIDEVLPKLDAFYTSLTDAQQDALDPRQRPGVRLFRNDRIERPDRPTR